jgi:hypothetical protein
MIGSIILPAAAPAVIFDIISDNPSIFNRVGSIKPEGTFKKR